MNYVKYFFSSFVLVCSFLVISACLFCCPCIRFHLICPFSAVTRAFIASLIIQHGPLTANVVTVFHFCLAFLSQRTLFILCLSAKLLFPYLQLTFILYFFLKSVRCYHMMYTKSYEPPVNFWKIFKKYRACAWATDLKVPGDQLLRRQFDPPHRKRVLVSIGIAMLEQCCNAVLC